jgi:two-component system phosphate regulon sensor histidine kinase PhoR
MDERLRSFWRSRTLQLTITNLVIIMVMSLSFSAVVYVASANQLNRQVEPRTFVDDNGEFGPTPRVREYMSGLVEDGKHDLLFNLITLNTLMLVLGTAVGYALARRTLSPIEKNMEAQTSFVSDASHELRTPLTSLSLTNEIALRNKNLKLADAKKVIEMNLEEAKRLQNLSNLLLALLTPQDQRESYGDVDLQHVTQKASDVVAPQALAKHITIKNTLKKPLIIKASEDGLTQAFVTLLDNAIKYSPEKSAVTIEVLQTRKYATVKIIDQGQGIASQDTERIFQRFYRTDEARTRSGSDGFGLGLPIAKQIIEAHEGIISVKSKPGNGSVFSIKLPIK